MEIKLFNIGFKWEDIAGMPWVVSDIGINGVRSYNFDVRKS